eukprot:Pgem_evm1s15650
MKGGVTNLEDIDNSSFNNKENARGVYHNNECLSDNKSNNSKREGDYVEDSDGDWEYISGRKHDNKINKSYSSESESEGDYVEDSN